MRIRIRILDLHWKKMDPDPDPGHFFKIYWIFITLNNFQNWSVIFILKLDELFRNEENFIISFFSKFQILVLGVKEFFFSVWLIFYPLDPDPWIRIFLRIRIQKAKILRIRIGNVYPKYLFNYDVEFPSFNWKLTYRVTFEHPTGYSTTFYSQFKFVFSIF